MSYTNLLVEAEQALRPRYEHGRSEFRVPAWHIVAEALRRGWGYPYEFSSSPNGTEAASNQDPESGRLVTIAEAPRSEVPSPSVDVWFAHEIDPLGPNPKTYPCAPVSLGGLLQDASCYLAGGEEGL